MQPPDGTTERKALTLAKIIQTASACGLAHNHGQAGQWLLCATERQLIAFAEALRAEPSMSTTSPPENSGTDERVQRLIQAIEGECEGLAITEQHAKAILEYVDGETEGGTKP